MTLTTPEGESFTELTPAERAYLLALLSKCATRNQLHEQYGIDPSWMRQSPCMPAPVFTWGHGWPMYDAHEIVIEWELSRKRRGYKPWRHQELTSALSMKRKGMSYEQIGIALDRTPRAVEWRLKQARRQFKEAA